MTDRDYTLSADREAVVAAQTHLGPLPRSIVRSNTYELLDGEWRFDLDAEDRGLAERWYLSHVFAGKATWPGAIEPQMAEAQDVQRGTSDRRDHIVAWYERDFTIPGAWCSALECLTQVTFGACGYETRVWLNGHLLKTVEGEEAHVGEYTSFSYELPPEYLQPINRLTVRIADSLDAEIPRGKQESRVFKRGGIWYETISGPVRSIWIEPVERNRLRSRLDVISVVEDRLVEFNFTTRVHDPGVYSLRVAAVARGRQEPPVIFDGELPLEAGEQRQRITVRIPDAPLWSPSDPQLYHLVARLTGPDGHVSQIETHFGLRKVEARGCSVYVNNERLYLDGVLYQPGTATDREMYQHMLAIKKMGCNLVRVHLAGIDPRIYDLADAIGLLLWVEVPSPHSSTQRSRENHRAELMRMLVHTGSHPAVVIWSLYNEDWGAEDIAASSATRQYLADTYDYMRLHHPQFLVVDNDGWQHVSVEGRLKADLLTVHLYTPDRDVWAAGLHRLTRGDLQTVAVKPLVVGDPFFYQGQLPIVLSEWGGFGFPDYGGPQDPGARAVRIRAFKEELRQHPIAGDVYTQAVGIEEEQNGLITAADGALLVEPGLLASAAGTSERDSE
jgi:beta-galactosidase/beta-glucuronidase